MDVLLVFGKIISIFSIVLVGVLAYKRNWLPQGSAKMLTNLMMNITGPCLVIYYMVNQDITPESANKTIQTLIFMFVALLIVGLLSIPYAKVLKVPPSEQGIYRLMVVFTNCGFMGYPLADAVFGKEGLFLAIIANLMFQFVFFSLGVLLLIYDRNGKKGFGDTFKSILSIPLVSAILGLILFFANVSVPWVLNDVLKILGDMTVPLSMIIIGIQLSQSSFKEVIRNRAHFITTIVRLIVVPALLFVIFMNFKMIDPLVFCVVIFAMCMPGAAFNVVIAEKYDCNAKLAAEGVFITTFFSLFTIPVIGTLLSIYLNLQ